jgi:hypothetical protein
MPNLPPLPRRSLPRGVAVRAAPREPAIAPRIAESSYAARGSAIWLGTVKGRRHSRRQRVEKSSNGTRKARLSRSPIPFSICKLLIQ